MSGEIVEGLAKKFSDTYMENTGVSFEGKSLKLNTEDDAKEVTQAINACQRLHFLNLEGNTLGVDAAKGIAKALESHSELKRALWKDMFTGRMKTEIPKALHFLGSGLVLAGAQLEELDLSDNAFGPIGVEGLVMLLKSAPCHTLQILKLNNNGLGISGGKMLSQALLDCYKSSKEAGKPLALKVFVVGRNRLENEGAKAIAEVFKTVGTLEEVVMPQNGIYHVGITALSEAFTYNPNLKVLNLNDNTIRAKGAAALANALPTLQKLEELNLGDCLLKTKGAQLLAHALSDGHKELKVVHLGFNEIRAKGALELGKAMRNKDKLTLLELGGNQFGEAGRQKLITELQNNDRLSALGSLSEDEDEDEDEDDEESESEESEESESEDKVIEEDEKSSGDLEKAIQEIQIVKLNDSVDQKHMTDVGPNTITVAEFCQNPTPERFLALGSNRLDLIRNDIKSCPEDSYVEKLMPLLMKVSSLCASNSKVVKPALACSDAIYRDLFKWSEKHNKMSLVNNMLLVHLGLIKSEDKGMKLSWNLDGCLLSLEHAIKQDYFPQGTRETLQLFLGRQVPCQTMGALSASKHKLMSTLYQY
ncbi:Ran GTPase-activating protein 1 [Blattella germanica]|nr:Ran GTPase-activating protein 1 [Blattella germanica]